MAKRLVRRERRNYEFFGDRYIGPLRPRRETRTAGESAIHPEERAE
ncbi:hypothetical protein [Tsukamurella soli]|uniref:Uncharacterized protein n=1 Tax=Tsukamurella soli TaxID=644556 RepID=A0ABP8JJ59_9ACTN